MIRVEQTYSQIVKFDLASNGYYGLVYSNDNGKTLHLLVGADGRLFEQKDGDRIWPFIVDKVRSIMRLDWDDVQGKPVLVTKDELDQRLSNLNIPSTDGLAKQTDLDNVKATADSATSKAEQAQSTADANTKALQNVYTKEESDRKYWTAEQERDAESNLNTNIQELIDDKANADDVYTKSEIDSQNASNVKSVNNIEPDDQGNVDIDLTDYAKKSDIPKMPDLSGYATVANLIDYAKKTDLPDFSQFVKKSEIPELPDTSNFANRADLDKVKATLNSNIDAAKVSYEQIYPTLINGTTGSVNAFLITLSEKVKMLSFWANITLPTIPAWSQVDIMSFPEMHEQNHITLNQAVVPDSSHSLWSDYTSTRFSLRNQTGATVSNYSFNFFSSGIFLY